MHLKPVCEAQLHKRKASVLALGTAELQDCVGSTLLPATKLSASVALTSVEPSHRAPQALEDLRSGLDCFRRRLFQTQPQSIPPSLDGIEVGRMLRMLFERDAASSIQDPHALRTQKAALVVMNEGHTPAASQVQSPPHGEHDYQDIGRRNVW